MEGRRRRRHKLSTPLARLGSLQYALCAASFGRAIWSFQRCTARFQSIFQEFTRGNSKKCSCAIGIAHGRIRSVLTKPTITDPRTERTPIGPHCFKTALILPFHHFSAIVIASSSILLRTRTSIFPAIFPSLLGIIRDPSSDQLYRHHGRKCSQNHTLHQSSLSVGPSRSHRAQGTWT